MILGSLAVLAALSMLPALEARARLDEARRLMQDGRFALLSGQVEEARELFFQAEDAFVRARDQVRNPLLRAASLIPLLGRSPDAVEAMADAGTLVARSGRVLSDALATLERHGFALGSPDAGGGLDSLLRAAPGLEDARDLVVEAEARVAALPGSFLLPPIESARIDFAEQLEAARRAVTSAAALARALPSFLGVEGKRTYFVAAQNPAELRGSGGFMGAYALLEADDGRLRLSDFASIDTLRDVDSDRIRPPNADYAARFDRYGGAGYWRNINMTGDFPSAATAIERLYEEVTGDAVDGVIAADPFALEALMGVTGPVTVPETGVRLDAGSVVPYLTNEAYGEIPSSDLRKRLLGEVAKRVLDRFLSDTRGPLGARALVDAAGDGHLLLHSTRPAEQTAFEVAGVGGALNGGGGDYLAVIGNNAAGNKADFYADRAITYRVQLGAQGTGIGDLTVELTNDTPSSGEPRYVIGPYSDDFTAGESVTLLDAYCAPGCGVEEFHIDGARSEVGSEHELGHPVFPVRVALGSGEMQELEYRWILPRAWDGDEGSGIYRLTFRGQPTIRPTQLVVDVRAPDGMSITSASPGMQIDGGRARWEGDAGDRMTFEVAFGRPFLSRIWHFLNRPVIRIG